MNLSTTYMGLNLSSPLMPGASPLVDDMDMVKRLQDAGAAAIVMHSLFEEQITREQLNTIHNMEIHAESFAEALSYFPQPDEYHLGPDDYLEQIRKIKAAVSVPVIASLNGVTAAGWLKYAKLMQEAGADALELNVYHLPTDIKEDGRAVEVRVLDILRMVKETINIPVAVKLSPFYSSVPHLAHQLDELGADGLILFNRFYEPDIDMENLELCSKLVLSTSAELLLRLRWLAILAGKVRASLAVSGGIHTGADALKSVMTGASAVQVVSALLLHGPEHLKKIKDEMAQWLQEHEYESLRQAQWSMSLQRCPDPGALERANYMRVLQSWKL